MEQLKLVFSLPEFEGPLDLLLFLVRKHRLDIRSIPITVIADEFMVHVDRMKKLDMEVTSDFIVMASTLMQMKSKALLPRLSPQEAEELRKQQTQLYRQIEEYKTLKELSTRFREKLYESYSYERVKVEASEEDVEVESLPERLVQSFKSILKETIEKEKVYTVTAELYSVEECMEEIEREYPEIKLLELLKNCESRIEAIVTFLAVLELIKLGKYEIVTLEPDPLIRRVVVNIETIAGQFVKKQKTERVK
ncbi:segregation and condensation protein A [Kosmotoga pacifica]|uniref:Segregation and condensation protein A n=1 Tax=Kosmotoga pacifica TaxID=1330330 RepID=A0A0G2ZE08_9BACT|nr:segregation/condensation protein A [Kosmotoga pacifica]AKI97794.1 chromosome segregation protein ScpA [Kosmotoga pacifica]